MSSLSARQRHSPSYFWCASTLLCIAASLGGCSLLVGGEALSAGCEKGKRACASECIPKSDDRYEHENKCLEAQICKPGERVWKERTATSDRECQQCPDGQYSDRENATDCAEPQVCLPGQYEVAPPAQSRDSDRDCAACKSGTFSTEKNAKNCVAFRVCPPGEVQTTPGTPQRDIGCEPCASSEYAKDGDCQAKTDCKSGEFLEREATTTMDALCTVVDDCKPGTFEKAEPTHTKNRECSPCPAGSFSATANTKQCSPWAQCLDSEWESEAPHASRDRGCTEVHDCAIGQIVEAEPTSTSDRSCSWCTQGNGANTVNPSECLPWTMLRFCHIDLATQALLCFGNEPLLPPTESPDANRKWTAVGGNAWATCAIPSDTGEPLCWGLGAPAFDAAGQGLSFSSVSLGFDHACGVLDDGDVYCWGSNSTGQSTPPAGKFRSVSAGFYHTCGVLADTGKARCWGTPPPGDDYGQVSETDEEIVFSSVSAGLYHTCGLVAETGRAMCWGIDADDPNGEQHRDYGQVNDTPADVEFSALASGLHHNCGLRKADAEIQCWGIDDQANGFEDYGQVRHTPSGVRFASVMARDLSSCGVREDGTVQCWGATVGQ